MSDDYPRASGQEQESIVTALAFFNQWRTAVREGDGQKADGLLVSIYRHLERGYLGEHTVNSDAALAFLGEYYRHKGKASDMEGCLETFVKLAGLSYANAQREAQEIIDGTHPLYAKKQARANSKAKQLFDILSGTDKSRIGEITELDEGAPDMGERALAGIPKELRAKLASDGEEKIRAFFADAKGKELPSEKVAQFFADLFPGTRVSAARVGVTKNGDVVPQDFAQAGEPDPKEKQS